MTAVHWITVLAAVLLGPLTRDGDDAPHSTPDAPPAQAPAASPAPPSAPPAPAVDSGPGAASATPAQTPQPATAEQPSPPVPPAPDAQTASTANPTTIEGVEKAKQAIQARLERLKEPAAGDKTAPPGPGDADAKELRQVLQERLARLDEWKRAVQDRTAAEREAANPPEKASDLESQIKHAEIQLDKARNSPESVLPDLFHGTKRHITETALGEMKDAIAVAQEHANELKGQVDAFTKSQSPEKISATFVGLRGQREKSRAALATLTARDAELDGVLAATTTPSTRELARERSLSVEIDMRIESERLLMIEAKLAIERQRSANLELKQKALLAQCDTAKWIVELMQARYRSLADQQHRELEKAAAAEVMRAEKENDPVEQFRAKRAASFLDLQSQILEAEQELTANPPPTVQEQSDRVEDAKDDFEGLKKLISSGRSNALVATRLTNSYRRLGAERELIISRELAQVAARISRFENALTEVEFDLLNDAREDQIELDANLARLPRSRHPEMLAAAEAAERKHRTLLETRQRRLTQLLLRAEEAHKQILERIRVLDEQHTYIRTHIFWVRDSAPLSLAVVHHLREEAGSLWNAGVGLAVDRSWKAPPAPVRTSYVLAMIGIVTLPWGLYRTRRGLHRMLERPA